MQVPTAIQEGIDATKVDYVRLGSSGLRISFPVLGAMSLGSQQWMPWTLAEDDALTLLKGAYDMGLNTWDTADMYSNGMSEEVIGKAIKKLGIPREKLVLLTKVYCHVAEEKGDFSPPFAAQMNTSKDYVNKGGLSRSAIFKAVDASLARLGTSYIDLYQVHRYDPDTPPEETMKALHDLVESGKVRYIGASSMWATQFAQMQFIAERNGWTKFISMQNMYNLCYREEEREMIRFCKETGVGIIPYSPMNGGKLARPLGYQESIRSKMVFPGTASPTVAEETIIRRVEELATKKNWKMSHVALAWHKSKGSIPIVGYNSVSRLGEACELRDKSLTDEEVKYLEEPYVPKPVTGHS